VGVEIMKFVILFCLVSIILLTGCDSLLNNNCPQLPIALTKSSQILGGVGVRTTEINGWETGSYTGLFANMGGTLLCKKGDVEGENPDYYYCGKCGFWGIMTKQERKSDGTLGPKVQHYFYSIYDSNGKFLKTVCGVEPTTLGDACLTGNDKVITKQTNNTITQVNNQTTTPEPRLIGLENGQS
jgi:hypothetical protein